MVKILFLPETYVRWEKRNGARGYARAAYEKY